MLKIAICDDKETIRETVKENVGKYLSEMNLLCEIDTFVSVEEFMDLGIEVICYSVVFVELNAQHFVTAQKLRKYSSETYLVFLADDTRYSLEGYKVGAVRYLLRKDKDLPASVFECMAAVIDKINNSAQSKIFKFNESEKKVSLDRILYIESRLHKLEFHIMEDKVVTYTLYGTLNDLENILDNGDFFRIHQSFLVNFKHVKAVCGYEMMLDNKQVLRIPKKRYRNVKNVFMEYMGMDNEG